MTFLDRLRARSPLVLKSGIAFVDQAVLSGTNFVITLVLMKTVAKEEYGYYSIAFAISLFLISLQNAIVTTPLAVLLAGKRDEERDDYVAALHWGQIITLVPAATAGLAITAFVYSFWSRNVAVLTIGGLCFAAVGILQREFLRAYHFARQSPSTVLQMDSSYAAVFLALIAAVYMSFRLTAPIAFGLMGISALVTSAFFKRGTWKFDWPTIRASYREHWPFAKWSLTGVMVTHVQSYSNLYLTGTFLGNAAAGTLSASKLPLSAVTLVQTGWNKVAIPRGAHLRERRQLGKFVREQMMVAAFMAVGIVLYVAGLLMASSFLKRVLFNRGYETAFDLIVVWAAINIVGFAGISASVSLQVMKEFGSITKINCVTMVITLACTVILIRLYGIKGGLASSLLGESLLAVSLWSYLIWRNGRESKCGVSARLRALRVRRALSSGGE